MTAPSYGAVDRTVTSAVQRMKLASIGRDAAMQKVLMVRQGRFNELWPESFSERYPESTVANFVDVAARDLAASLAPLPSLACSAGNMRTDADKARASKKNRIGSNYWRESRLQTQMQYGADQYITYGFLPMWVEADYKRQMPIIHVEDPVGCYFDIDRWGVCRKFCREWRQDTSELAALFPEYANKILNNDYGVPYEGTETAVVQYIDNTNCILYLPERSSMVVASYGHGMPYCPVHIATRPGVQRDPRGQYDDVIYVQMAKMVMSQLTLEAGHKSVQAPLAVPSDIQEINIGPDAMIVTDSPEKVQRIRLDVPNAAFALNESLSEEMKSGAGYPDSRMGNGPAGGSTGRGIDALQGGFDTQVQSGQYVIGEALRLTTQMCFDMDFKLFGRKTKTINGTLSGEPFMLTYTPGKDLAGNVQCEVSYGFASGQSPNGAIVTLLQLRGDDLIGRDTVRRQLPFDIDPDQAQREVDVQVIEDGLKQGLAAMLQGSGQMVMQGGDPSKLYAAAVAVIQGRREGKDLAALFAEAFPPPPPAPAAPPGVPGAPGAPGAPPGAPPDGTGLPQGVAQGQAGLPPGGRPSIQDLTAGFTGSGAPNVGATIRRRIATG